MKKIFLVVLSVAFILSQFSCDDDESGSGFRETLSEVFESSILDTVNVNQVFTISMKHYGSDGCAEYSRTSKSLDDSTLNLLVYQKKDPSLICTQAIITINSGISYSFQKSGRKYIRFNEVNHLIDSVYVK